MSPYPALTDTLGTLGSLTLAVAAMLIVLAAPVMVVLTIRFLWYRHVYIGKSKEMETLIWQLHRIASALEAQNAGANKTETPTVEPVIHTIPMSIFGR